MKKKIRILGGGIAGLTTAFELTREENWKDKYDITIYQMGWRCGGKAATGVGKHGRIEEVGVHIFQGWYHNAFRMVKEVYEEIQEYNLAPDSPYTSWKDAFIPNPYTFNTEYNPQNESWDNWTMVFPNNEYTPGTTTETDFLTLLVEGLGILLQTLLGSPFQEKKNGKKKLRYQLLQKLFFSTSISKEDTTDDNKKSNRFMHRFFGKVIQILEGIITKMVSYKKRKPSSVSVSLLVGMFRSIKKYVQRASKRCEGKRKRLRRVLMMIELSMVCIEGIYGDVYDPKTKLYTWDAINEYDFREWLTRHGASKDLLEFSMVRFIYYGTFGNVYGGNGTVDQGKIGADIGIKMITRIQSYKGCFVWYLAAGTGGTFLAPLALVLQHRGVRFEYFHQVRDIAYSENENIQKIKIDVQVDLKEGIGQYNPFVIQKGVHQWTATPDFEQIDPIQAEQIKKQHINLESSTHNWKPVVTKTLSLGVDFDIAILATSIQPIKYIAKDIVAKKERWNKMVTNIATTPTLNVQFWLNQNDTELGFDHGQWGMEKGQYANTVIYEDYLYSWTSMSYLDKMENWKDHAPKQISYWCGVWPENFSKSSKTETLEELKTHANEWMDKHMEWFWPNAVQEGSFNFDLLCSDAKTPQQKFEDQFFQVNVDPDKQYVLGRPGTNKYRIKTDETEYDNLFFAGDWTDFGLNVGYMEGTVQSGILCANSIKKRYYRDMFTPRNIL
ncbi:NAD(P)-binding protein [Aquimarina spongiae]|uniref:NAD(P)-binding Rossmann-like domain-containing protein n=1 Tax=Aquimarina spongiae TaxID=570521 RepID=A0A1M6B309_9FLAO|nr:NAD(P)-binding protein [Aquimarina spongiae]SHI43124.1 NAD(P)-binding Rossmann-like domain-containing protein [Aquimarina spongiae]